MGLRIPTGLRGKPAGYLQAWLRISPRDYREQIQLAVRAGLELEASELQVQRSKYSATLPPLNRECETVIGRILITIN